MESAEAVESAGVVERDGRDWPEWVPIAGWAAGAAALLFVVVGAVFLPPGGDRSIDVSRPFEVGLGADSLEEIDDPEIPTGETAAVDPISSAVDDAPPAELSFVDDGEAPPALVEASPLDSPDVASDGSAADDAPTLADVSVADDAPSLADEALPVPADSGFSDSFETVGPPWTALAGSWAGSGGRFVQQDTEGFDLIAQLEVDLPEEYKLSVVMAPMSGPLSAGVLVGQQTPGERAGAWLVDFSEDGTFVRVGRYGQQDGAYEYLEGQAVPDGFDPAGTHEISLIVEATDMTVFLDGQFFTVFDPAPPGRIGLVTNRAATAFDDFVIEPL